MVLFAPTSSSTRSQVSGPEAGRACVTAAGQDCITLTDARYLRSCSQDASFALPEQFAGAYLRVADRRVGASPSSGYRLRSVEDDATFASLSSAAQMGDRNHEDSRHKSGAGRDGLARRRAKGKRTGGNSYALTWRRNEKDERETIPDPERAPIVDRINAEYLEGRPLMQIVKGLNADHVPTQRGGKWSVATVCSILENPVYAGMIRDGDRLIDAQFEAIISRERYFEALRLRKARKQTHKRGRQPVGQHLFRQGFLRHGECGGGMSPRTERNKDGTLRERYRCNTHYFSPTDCDLTTVPRAPIDTSVYNYFLNVGLDLEETRAQIMAASEQKVAESADFTRAPKTRREGEGAA